jgi:hypothetical protein
VRARASQTAIIFFLTIIPAVFAALSTASQVAFERDVVIAGGGADCIRNTPSIAADGQGSVYLVWQEKAGSDYRVAYTFSRDSGATWSEPVTIPDADYPAQADPVVSLGPRGVVHFVWLSFVRGSVESAIRTCASQDGGATLGPVTTLSDNDPYVMVDRPWSLADSRSGRLHVAYSQWAGSIKVRTASPWLALGPSILNRDLCREPEGIWPVLRQDSDGRVYVCWLSWSDSGYEVRLARSMRPEQGFSALRTVSDLHFGVRPELWAFGYPVLAVGAPGRVYVAWCDDRRKAGDWDLLYTYSTNFGDTFKEPAHIHKGTEPGELSILPWMDVDPYGRVHVAWYHYRPQARAWEILYSSSEDGGDTFSEPVVISDCSFPGGAYLGDFLGLACDWNYVYVAWGDNRTGVSDVYVTRAKIGPKAAGRLVPVP